MSTLAQGCEQALGWQSATAVTHADRFDLPYMGKPWDHQCDQLSSSRLSASVIIPAWNSATSLGTCLRSLELSSLNRLAPERLEVIVCDDGSSDSTWQLLTSDQFGLRLSAAQLEHGGQSAAANYGLDRATGDVAVFCDSDMVLGCGALDEMLARHEEWPDAVCFGFRSDGEAPDQNLWAVMHSEALSRDNRLAFDVPTVLTNMLVASSWLEALSGNRAILDSQGSMWRRHRFVYGCLFSADRRQVLACEGFPDALRGWGYNDTLLAARLEATGSFLLPVLSAWGWHMKHELRHPNQWFQYARNRLAYERLLDCPADRRTWRRRETSRPLAEHATTSMPRHTRPELSPRTILCNSATLHALGFWSELLDAYDHSTTVVMLSESFFWLERYEEATACTPTATLWAALSRHRLGDTAGAYRLLNAAADHDATAAYACQASCPELEYLRDHHLAADLTKAAQLYQDVLEISGWRRPLDHTMTHVTGAVS
ncbi:MAG: glycosyltransferase [Pseudonocardiaceae bacterium]